MSRRAVKHEIAERPFVGTPRPLPRVLMCHVPREPTGAWCGRHWTANTMDQYAEAAEQRRVHMTLCGSLSGVF